MLASGGGQWWILTWNSYGTGSWSSGKTFNIAAGCNINEHFSTTPSDWTQESGTWNIASSQWWYTQGQASKSNISRYSGGDCGDIDITTRMWKGFASSGEQGHPARLIIRSSGTIDSSGFYPNEYLFQYTPDGSFSVYKHVAGVETAVKYWTSSSAINTGAAWNKMRVYASGSSFWFYINDTLVWHGSDSSLSTGKIGVGMYSQSVPGNHLWVDYVTSTALDEAADRSGNTVLDVIDDNQQEETGSRNGDGVE